MCSFTILNNWSQREIGVWGTICNKGNGSNRHKLLKPQLGITLESEK